MSKCEYRRVKKTSSRKHLNQLRVDHNSSHVYSLHGEDVIAITKSQIDRRVKAYEAKKGMTIEMIKTQLAHK